MFTQSFDHIADVVLQRRGVYSLEVESQIRELANRMSAKAFMETIVRFDDRDPKFPEALSELCRALPVESGNFAIGFSEDIVENVEDAVSAEEPTVGATYYLRLMFANEDAAYYQYPVFPNMVQDYIASAARKRAGDSQYVRLDLTEGKFLQTFIEECRQNPHFVRVEECSEKEFWAAPSNGV